MAFINTVKTISAQAVPTEYVSSLAVALTVGTVTTALTGFVNYVRSGRVRLKVTTPNGGQITAIKITGTDGTTTSTYYQDAVARTINETDDLLFNFVSELNLTTVSVAVTVATATITADLEIAGNS